MSASDDRNAPAADGPQEKRRASRRRIIWSGRIVSAIGDRPCTVFSVSDRGAHIKLDATLDPGSSVELTLPKIGRVSAWVVWSRDDRAGIEFRDLSEAQAAALDQALRGRGPGGA